MTALRLATSRPASWMSRRIDPNERRRIFGPIRPMPEPSLLRRLFRLF